ncbi:MAG: glucose-6-phosphate dehydrogenase [Armatimonadetes bacterium]|nr:glucose-6-phosphate dehydrogenase [Armatimonadota bacterium]
MRTNKPDNCLMVIFGASGDLTRRKLLPALFDLSARGLLPDRFGVLGVSRSPMDDDSFREQIAEALRSEASTAAVPSARLNAFLNSLFYEALDTTDPAQYSVVADRVQELDSRLGTDNNYFFYMATPPSLFITIADGLELHGLARSGENAGWRRVIVEKPFGTDLASARKLNERLREVFGEQQIYRIDHYLGKETVQNLLVFRFSNGIFEPLWNRNYVHNVQVTAAEAVGVEQRGRYYDGVGALRDMLQNHLLHVLGMVAMEPPARFEADAVRNETIKVFQALRRVEPREVKEVAVRGQYMAGEIAGEPVRAYRDEPGVSRDSTTETYVAMRVFVDNWRWGGVPFFLRTGKRLPMRATEVVLNFRQTPHCLFGQACGRGEVSNQLVLRLQPDEGITLRFGLKIPGAGFQVQQVDMDFRYAELSSVRLPSAYERLLLDCMLGDPTLYTRADAVEACWEFVEPFLEAWRSDPEAKLYGYRAGTWGPKAADRLVAAYQARWHEPCPPHVVVEEDCPLS